MNKCTYSVGICIQCIHSNEYHFLNMTKNWTDAQHYCRDKYTDLVTITSMEDINNMPRPAGHTKNIWIGLFDDPRSWDSVTDTDSNSWKWSATGTTSATPYENWKSGEPDYFNGKQKCGAIQNGLWLDHYCYNKYYFVCYTGIFFFIKSDILLQHTNVFS